jgi:G:T-mismatch repair DNA endonuclease (very short patch repair protein)
MGAYYKAKYAGAKNPNWRSYVVKKCANCGKEFNVTPYHSNRKFCSQNCCREYLKNHPSIGKALTEKHKRKISLGVKNVWKIKREELLAKISRNPGRLRLLSMRFKENNPSKDSKIKQKIRFARMKQRIPTSLTAPETKFLNIINLCGLPYKYVGNGTFWVGSLNPDFIHVSEKKAIDVFGDYWHRKRKVPWYQTEYGRKEYFRKHGWSLLVIWESQLNSLSEIEVGRMVLEWSNIMESASTIQG